MPFAQILRTHADVNEGARNELPKSCRFEPHDNFLAGGSFFKRFNPRLPTFGHVTAVASRVNALISVNPTFGGLGTLMSPAPLDVSRTSSGIVVPAVSNAPPAPTGFVNLINLLLGPAVPYLSPDPSTSLEANSIAQNEPVDGETTRSPQLIADALIRSMLNRSMSKTPLLGTAVSSTARKDRNSTPAADQSRTASIAGTPVAIELVAPVPSPPISPPVTTQATAPASSQDHNPKTVQEPPPHGTAALPTTAVKPELAFSLRLTPIETLKVDVSEGPGKPAAELPANPLPQAQAPTQSLSPGQSEPQPRSQQPQPEPLPGAAAEAAPMIAAKPIAPKEAGSKLAAASSATQERGNPRPASQAAQDAVPTVAAVASPPPAGDHAASFARALDVPSPGAPATFGNPAPAEHTPQTATEALRASEPAVPMESPTPPTSTHGIAVRIALPDTPHVDVQVVDRAGQVQVAVRTPDTELQASLRQDLGTLVNSLERSGFHTEAFTPHDAIPQAGASSQMNFQNNSHHQDPGSGEQGHPSGNPGGGSRDRQQESQQQGQQRQRSRLSQAWIEALENAA
jgi:hypothetical protein